MLATNKTINKYICQNCGVNYSKWQGKCSSCLEWNTIEKVNIPKEKINNILDKNTINALNHNNKPIKLDDIENSNINRINTNNNELNNVLGGGIVKGSLILLGGEPGIGKSTLALQLALKIKKKVFYASGEESIHQIKLRAKRLSKHTETKNNTQNCYLINENNILNLFDHIKKISPEIIIIDSIQTLFASNYDSIIGSISQIRICTNYLVEYAKKTHIPVIVISHITKDGFIAGPKLLEHMVDTVVYFEGEKYSSYRILRTIKNRFGSCNEIGIFEMQNDGLKEISNPSEILLSNSNINISGTAVGSFIEGNRPLLVEAQSLASKAVFGNPQRTANGFDIKRLNMLIAVLENRTKLTLKEKDIFLNIAGGIKVKDSAIDLAICMAIYSSIVNECIPNNICYIAEIGLGGETRPVNQIEKRINEAKNIGFKKIFISQQNIKNLKKNICKNLNIIPIQHISEVINS